MTQLDLLRNHWLIVLLMSQIFPPYKVIPINIKLDEMKPILVFDFLMEKQLYYAQKSYGNAP